MTQDQSEYKTEVEEALAMLGVGYDNDNPAVIIEKPRKDLALRDGGLTEYKVWGWVKKSAKFIYHVRRLRGAKLSIWEVVSLSIDENGECALSLKDLVMLTGYSRSEVSESLQELEEMGYLSIEKEAGKKSVFKPSFAARGDNSPSEEPIQKTDGSDTRPVSKHGYPSSSPEENLVPSYRELKELKDTPKIIESANKTVDAILEQERKASEADKQGKAWRGRELVMDAYLPYGDWWHKKTGLHMYAAKAKPKANSSWIKEFQAWWENDLTTEVLELAFQAEVSWRGVITHPRELTAKAIALSVNPNPMSAKNQPPVSNVKRSTTVQFEDDGTPITF